MTETPPEAFLPDPAEEPSPPEPPEPPEPVDEDDPARDADGVTEDRLTGVAFYDTLLGCYVGGVYPSKTAARKGEDRIREFVAGDRAARDRYVLRRV